MECVPDQSDGIAAIFIQVIVGNEVSLWPAVVAGVGRIVVLINVQAVGAAIAKLVVRNDVVGGSHAESNAGVAVGEAHIVADHGAGTGKDGYSAVAIQTEVIALNQPVVAGAMKYESILRVGHARVVTQNSMIASRRGKDAMQAVVVNVVVLNYEVIRVVVRVEPIGDVMIHFVDGPIGTQKTKAIAANVIV